MANLLYCGTNPVGPAATQELLIGKFRAIWAPPMYRQSIARSGDRIWLMWRDRPADEPVLLGQGIVQPTREGKVDWTNRTAPGIVAAARSCGYGGPSNMAFLRLQDVSSPESTTVVSGLGRIPTGLTTASRAQELALEALADN